MIGIVKCRIPEREKEREVRFIRASIIYQGDEIVQLADASWWLFNLLVREKGSRLEIYSYRDPLFIFQGHSKKIKYTFIRCFFFFLHEKCLTN